MTAIELLQSLDAVRARGNGRWSARCPAHADRSPSLSISEGDKGILLRCWAGCTLEEITSKLGLRMTDLFFDAGLPGDSAARQKAQHERRQRKAAKRAAYTAMGQRMETLREAEYVVQSAKGISIAGWSNTKLDLALNTLADAYERLWEESHEWR